LESVPRGKGKTERFSLLINTFPFPKLGGFAGSIPGMGTKLKTNFMIVQTYKHKNRIICYIRKNLSKGTFSACTGKPSDTICISWNYPTIEEAQFTAQEFYNNFTLKTI
jgi:hypothetical protein